mmetsp:Transcript_28539/g.94788  ORF Transcript_28539/g.94788 Transcript_28539/m.94788 type:complete len:203 (-) Transcript_28539:881-1489(-)
MSRSCPSPSAGWQTLRARLGSPATQRPTSPAETTSAQLTTTGSTSGRRAQVLSCRRSPPHVPSGSAPWEMRTPFKSRSVFKHRRRRGRLSTTHSRTRKTRATTASDISVPQGRSLWASRSNLTSRLSSSTTSAASPADLPWSARSKRRRGSTRPADRTPTAPAAAAACARTPVAPFRKSFGIKRLASTTTARATNRWSSTWC